MSASASSYDSPGHQWRGNSVRRIVNGRAALAFAWAVALSIAAGSHSSGAEADLQPAVAVLLASYPLIDVTASILTARLTPDARLVMSVNAAVSAAAIAAIATTGFSSSAGTTVASFGAWASVSGLIQLSLAIHRRRADGGQGPMIVSGGLSTLAGIMFIAGSSGGNAHVTTVAGYMALGALLYVLWIFRERTRAHHAG